MMKISDRTRRIWEKNAKKGIVFFRPYNNYLTPRTELEYKRENHFANIKDLLQV